MSEFTPPWSNVKMTKAQVKKYIKDIKKAQKIAQKKLEKAKTNWDFDKEKQELEKIENKIDNL